jgi:hypothetical protein
MNWKDYEKKISEHFRLAYPDATIQADVRIQGRYSKTERQIDILIEDYVAGTRFRTVVDGKYFSSKIDVKDVETFIGMLADVEAHKGLLITSEGYSQAAVNRAFHDPGDLELDILNFKEINHLQGFGAIPYSGSNGVLLPAPFGWVIDGKRREGMLATLYQRGLTLEEAGVQKEWMYVKISEKSGDLATLDQLLKYQEQYTLESFHDAKIAYLDTIKRNDAHTVLRRIDVPTYPTPELTGFVEFKDFIFVAVLFTPVELSKKNIRKLEYVMAKVLPLKVKDKSSAIK